MTNKRIVTAVVLVAAALYTQWLSQPDAIHNAIAPTATPRPLPTVWCGL